MLMQIDGTFIFAAISFLIFLFIIKAILYTPFSRVLNERQNFYDKNTKIQEESKQKTKDLIEKKEALLKDSRFQASNIIKETSIEAKKRSQEILSKAQNEVKLRALQHKEELIDESNKTKEEIKAGVNSIVSSIISRVLKENIEVSLDDEKINKYLRETKTND